MCGRFANDVPADMMHALFATAGPLPNPRPSYNIAPSQMAPVIRRHPQTGERRLDLLRWGLIPSWSKAPGRRPINARAETVARTAMFRGAYAARRCLVPARAFYEWQQGSMPKQPIAIARADGVPLALAGLWESWRDGDEIVRTFAIVTTAANALMAPIHDRMPVILEPADWPVWLGEQDGDAAALMRPAQAGVLRCWPVSSRVNSPRHDEPELLEPVAAPAPPVDEDEAGPDPA